MAMHRIFTIALLAAAIAAPSAAHAKRVNLTLNFGQDVLLVGEEDLSVRVRCVQNDAGFDRLQVYAVTANDAVLRSPAISHPGGGNYLTPASTFIESLLAYHHPATGAESVLTGADGGAVMNLTTKRGYAVNTEATVLGVNTPAADCIVSVDIREIKKFKETF